MAECIFCQIVGGVIPTKKLYEDDQVIAFDDLNPQARVHVFLNFSFSNLFDRASQIIFDGTGYSHAARNGSCLDGIKTDERET